MGFLKKYFIFILLAFTATALFAIRFSLSGPTNGPASRGVSPPSWKTIVPGKTTAGELEKALGKPSSLENLDTNTVFKFESEMGGPPHTVVVEGQTVGLIKERFGGSEVFGDFVKKYGNSEGEFWGPYKEVGFKLFVFSSRGIAVLANQTDGTILEVWYFEPTAIDGFLKKWGAGLENEPKTSF